MKPTPYNILKGIRYLKNYGFKEFVIRLKEKSEPEDISYKDWYLAHCATEEELQRQRREAARWKNTPKISILVPTYQTPPEFLRQMVESVQKQTYTNWELCIADATPLQRNDLQDIHSMEEEQETVKEKIDSYATQDNRIKYLHLEKNLGIAENTNAALKMATGEYVGLLDHDDLLAPNALYEMVKAILFPKEVKQSGVHWDTYYKKMQEAGMMTATEGVQPDVLYSDEDKVTEDMSEHYAPHFKPDFSLDLLRTNNYITHFFVVRKSLAEKVGGFSKEFDGAQDYDFILRCVEQAKGIVHIPKVLYHWRMHAGSTAGNQESKTYAFDAGKEAVEAHLARAGVAATVESTENLGFYRVKYPVQKQSLISILIPNKDEVEALEKCLQSIAKSSYVNYEVVIVENNSAMEETFSYYKKIQEENVFFKTNGEPMSIRVVTWESNGIFNYSAINNYGMQFVQGEYVVLLNNDIEVLTEGWLEEMLASCQRPEVGITGARLYYPDDSIQHAGIVVGIGGHARGAASNMLVGTRRIHDGYLHKAGIQLNYSAVTAACLMIRKSIFDEIGGFTERLTIAFNDVDLCLKVRKAGYQIVYNPYVEAYHYESKSRGQEDSEEKVRRFQTEIEYMRTQWNDILRYGDPFYNPNFSRVKCDYSLNGMD